jgi:hypothetical protein
MGHIANECPLFAKRNSLRPTNSDLSCFCWHIAHATTIDWPRPKPDSSPLALTTSFASSTLCRYSHKTLPHRQFRSGQHEHIARTCRQCVPDLLNEQATLTADGCHSRIVSTFLGLVLSPTQVVSFLGLPRSIEPRGLSDSHYLTAIEPSF